MDVPVSDEWMSHLARASSLAMDPAEYADVPDELTVRLRSICTALPQTSENPAWAGTQWRIRKQTFAHILTVDSPDGPTTVLTFRAPEPDALLDAGLPFFQPAWGKHAVGLILDQPNWPEITELVTDSYRTQAPKKLTQQLDGESGGL